MKLLKSIVSLLIVSCGIYAAYLAFLSYEQQAWSNTGLYAGTALILLCLGIASLLLTLAKKKAKEINPSVQVTQHDTQSFEENSGDFVDRDDEVLSEHEINEGTQLRQEESISSCKVAMIDDLSTIIEPERVDKTQIVDPSVSKSIPIEENPVEIKEDPKFLFGDWWVDEDGLYTDVRLISISGRKQQKFLKKIALHTELTYHINMKNESIEIVISLSN